MDSGTEIDWYAMIDKLRNEDFVRQLGKHSKEEVIVFCINLIRGWAFQKKQDEIREEHFYKEVLTLLNTYEYTRVSSQEEHFL